MSLVCHSIQVCWYLWRMQGTRLVYWCWGSVWENCAFSSEAFIETLKERLYHTRSGITFPCQIDSSSLTRSRRVVRHVLAEQRKTADIQSWQWSFGIRVWPSSAHEQWNPQPLCLQGSPLGIGSWLACGSWKYLAGWTAHPACLCGRKWNSAGILPTTCFPAFAGVADSPPQPTWKYSARLSLTVHSVLQRVPNISHLG